MKITDKDNIAKTVTKNSIYTIVYNVWYLGSRIVITPFILYHVSIEEYGLWSYCFVVLSYLALTAFGFNNTYIKYAAEYRSRNENTKLNELISTGMISMVIFSIVLFLLFLLVLPHLMNLLGIDIQLHETAKGLLTGTAAIFVFNFTLAGYQSILEGEQKIALVKKIHLLASVLEIFLIVLFFKIGLGVYSLLWAYVVRFSLIIVLSIFFAYRVFPFLQVRISNFSKEAFKKFVGFGNQMTLLGFLSLFINSIDRILLTKILHLEAVGFYEVGRKLPNIGLMLPASIAGTMMPAASHLDGSEQHERLKEIYLASTRYLVMFSSIMYAFLIFFAAYLIEVWIGVGYSKAVPVMQILGIGTFANLFTGIGTAFVRGIGKPGYEIKYMAVSSILILMLSPLLIYYQGIIGAALAYCIAQTIGSVYFLFMANRLFTIPWGRFIHQVCPPAVLIFLLGLPPLFLCQFLWVYTDGSRWTGLFVLGISFGLYMLLVFFTVVLIQEKMFSLEERSRISALKLPGSLNTVWSKLWRSV